jgi:hypothetical protein
MSTSELLKTPGVVLVLSIITLVHIQGSLSFIYLTSMIQSLFRNTTLRFLVVNSGNSVFLHPRLSGRLRFQPHPDILPFDEHGNHSNILDSSNLSQTSWKVWYGLDHQKMCFGISFNLRFSRDE